MPKQESNELGGAMKMKKFILFFVNLLCMIIGIALLIMGIVIQTGSLIAFLKEFSSGFGSMGMYAIVAGLIVFFISFIGCLGAWKESWCLLFVYGAIILLLLIVVIVFSVVVIVGKPKWEKVAQETMTEWLTKFGTNKKYDSWTKMQETLDCCGVNTYTDWAGKNVSFAEKHPGSVPDSCCLKEIRKANATDCGAGVAEEKADKAAKQINTEGCYSKMREWISGHSTKITIAFVVFIVVLLIVVIVSCCLAGGIRKRNKYNSI